MKTQITIHADEVLACEPARDDKGNQAKTKDDKQLFQIAFTQAAQKKVGNITVPTTETHVVKSEVEVKPGSKNLVFECEQYAIASGTKVNLYYRVKAVQQAKADKKAS